MSDRDSILVVDDELHIRTILKYMLEKEGFRVTLACDGTAALEILQNAQPDLVLLDVMMPGLDGYSILAKIRDNHLSHNLPVIMLTAKGDIPDKVRGLQEGANDYLIKPFIPDELMLRVRNMLQLSRTQRDANPLTGLPGNRAIENNLKRRLARNEPFGFLYLDLDNFKSFNDYYGYARGDKVLMLFADILHKVIDYLGNEDIFVGHVGGDDFVTIMSVEQAPIMADAVLEAFDSQIRFLYEPEDWSRGYLEIPDRTGSITHVPPVSVTIAMVLDESGSYGHVGKLNSVAAELKKYGKSKSGSVVITERRGSELSESVLVPGEESETQL
jgi:PleD family two-component response regulator